MFEVQRPTWNLELGTWNLELGTWNPEHGTWIQGWSATRLGGILAAVLPVYLKGCDHLFVKSVTFHTGAEVGDLWHGDGRLPNADGR